FDRGAFKQLSFPKDAHGELLALGFGADRHCLFAQVFEKKAGSASSIEVSVRDLSADGKIVLQSDARGPVECAHFSSDGSYFTTVTVLRDKWVAQIWDLRTNKQVAAPMPHSTVITRIDVSPDGKRLTAWNPSVSRFSTQADWTLDLLQRDQVSLWDLTTG